MKETVHSKTQIWLHLVWTTAHRAKLLTDQQTDRQTGRPRNSQVTTSYVQQKAAILDWQRQIQSERFLALFQAVLGGGTLRQCCRRRISGC